MYPFVKPAYLELSVDQRKELCSHSYRIATAIQPWTAAAKQKVMELMDKAMTLCPFIRKDLTSLYKELEENNPLMTIPFSVLHCIRAYFEQFYVVKEKKLCLPAVGTVNASKVEKPQVQVQTQQHTQSTPTTTRSKIRAITEETWWVVRVKNEYRMCKLTFDRGEYWEMVEYQDGRVLNPQYRFPKYDNRVIYEFKEHITPAQFEDKIKEAVQIRKAALLAQAQDMLLRFDTVIIARHLTGGTLVGGVEEEDDTNWYLDTYNEHGEHIFYGDNRWELDKKSRCTVVQILKRK